MFIVLQSLLVASRQQQLNMVSCSFIVSIHKNFIVLQSLLAASISGDLVTVKTSLSDGTNIEHCDEVCDLSVVTVH